MRNGEEACNGICLHASDVGIYIPSNPVAYAHPGCPEHGTPECCEHCQGWGNFSGRDSEENKLMCPMCDGTGRIGHGEGRG